MTHFTPFFELTLLLVAPGALVILLIALLWTGARHQTSAADQTNNPATNAGVRSVATIATQDAMTEYALLRGPSLFTVSNGSASLPVFCDGRLGR